MLALDLSRYFNFSQWEVSGLDIGVLIGYFFLMMLVGYICKQSSSNVSDYVRMSCKSTWWLMGLSIYMQAVSALTFTGNGSQAYLAGWSVILATLGGIFGLVCQAMFFAPWLRRTRAITPADAVRLRFGPVVEQIYVYAGIGGSMFWGGMMLFGLGNFISAVFLIPIQVIIIFVGIIVVFYSVSGGSWSVQITDSLQSFIMIPICMLIAILSLKMVGGFSGLLDLIHQSDFAKDYTLMKATDHEYVPTVAGKIKTGLYTLPWLAASFCHAFIVSANLTGCHRYLSTKTDSDARKAAVFAAILLLLGSTLWLIPPMVARVKLSDQVDALARQQAETTAVQEAAKESGQETQEDKSIGKLATAADGAYAIVAKEVLPPGLLGLIIIAMFAATMSSLDSFLTGTAGLVTNNIYPPLIRLFGGTPWDGTKLLNLTKLVNFLLGCWAICLALIINKYGTGGVYSLSLDIVLFIGAPVGLPFALTFFIKKLPNWGPLVGMCCGLINSAHMKFGKIVAEFFSSIISKTGLIEFTGNNAFIDFEIKLQNMAWHNKLYLNLAVILIPTFLTTLFWSIQSRENKDMAERFFKQIRTPVDFKKEVGTAVDHSLLITVGGLGLIIAAGIMSLIFFSEDTAGKLSVLFVAGFIGTISLIMFITGKRKGADVESEGDLHHTHAHDDVKQSE